MRRTYCKRFEEKGFDFSNSSSSNSNSSNSSSNSNSSDELFGSYTPVFEEDYIQSLCNSAAWDTNGGKSGATFTKSNDNRFILKRIRKTEYDMFVSLFELFFQVVQVCSSLFKSVQVCSRLFKSCHDIVSNMIGFSFFSCACNI